MRSDWNIINQISASPHTDNQDVQIDTVSFVQMFDFPTVLKKKKKLCICFFLSIKAKEKGPLGQDNQAFNKQS